MPTDLLTMQMSMKFFQKLKTEVSKKEGEFPEVREQYQTLGIFYYLYFYSISIFYFFI